jgi:hypothetical protein
MDTDWTKDLKPDEAQAALNALKVNNAPVTAREATELIRLRRALQAKVEERPTFAEMAVQKRKTA